MRNPLLPSVERFLQLAWAGAQRQAAARATLGFGPRVHHPAGEVALPLAAESIALPTAAEPMAGPAAEDVDHGPQTEQVDRPGGRQAVAQLALLRDRRAAALWPSPESSVVPTGTHLASSREERPRPAPAAGIDPAVAAWFAPVSAQAHALTPPAPWSTTVVPSPGLPSPEAPFARGERGLPPIALSSSDSPLGLAPGAPPQAVSQNRWATGGVQAPDGRPGGAASTPSGAAEQPVLGAPLSDSGVADALRFDPVWLGADPRMLDAAPRLPEAAIDADPAGPHVLLADLGVQATAPRAPHADLRMQETAPRAPHADLRVQETAPRAPHADLRMQETAPRAPHDALRLQETAPRAPHDALRVPETAQNLPQFLPEEPAPGLEIYPGAPVGAFTWPTVAPEPLQPGYLGTPLAPMADYQLAPMATPMPAAPPYTLPPAVMVGSTQTPLSAPVLSAEGSPITTAQLRALITEILLTDGLRHGLFLKEG